MHVLDHAPQAWFLLGEAERLLLDVNCSHGPVGYSVLLALTPEETAAYARDGAVYLTRLAQAVQEAGPGSAYQRRDLSATLGAAVVAAIQRWRSLD